MSDNEIQIILPQRSVGRQSKEAIEQYEIQLKEFAEGMKKYSKLIGLKVSSRGWCYIAEGDRLITKGNFDVMQDLINDCRKTGLLPIDFVKVDEARLFENVEALDKAAKTPEEYIIEKLKDFTKVWKWKRDVPFWKTQPVYLQMMVEKIDVKTLFLNVCRKYHVPIANARGWSDIYERADFITRFKEAHDLGKRCVLLYFGDFDPAGRYIAEKLNKNIDDIKLATGFDSSEIEIDHFGLNFDFIEQNNLLWIQGLETASGKQANEKLEYVRDYVAKYGRRKCEANAILKIRSISEKFCEDAILKYLDKEGIEEYKKNLYAELESVKQLMQDQEIFAGIDLWIEAILNEVEAKKLEKNNSTQDLNLPNAIESDQMEETKTEVLEPGNEYVFMYLHCSSCATRGLFQVLKEDSIEISKEINDEIGKVAREGRKHFDLEDIEYKCLHCAIFDEDIPEDLFQKYEIYSWSFLEDEFLDYCYVFIPPSRWEQVIQIYVEWEKSIKTEEERFDVD